MKDIIIAIDGYSGTGKSSTARQVAQKLGYDYIDSGAMYRAITYDLITHDIDPNNSKTIERRLSQIRIEFRLNEQAESEIYLNNENVSSVIRSHQVNNQVSTVASNSEVRKKLVQLQKEIGQNKKIVMDGRDIGTVVFPNAELKIFMTAQVNVRAQRRKNEMEQSGILIDIKEVETNLIDRDKKDSTRSDSPLVKSEDAIEVDTTFLSFEEQVDQIVSLARERMSQGLN
jgi:cytidylate kinase